MNDLDTRIQQCEIDINTLQENLRKLRQQKDEQENYCSVGDYFLSSCDLNRWILARVSITNHVALICLNNGNIWHVGTEVSNMDHITRAEFNQISCGFSFTKICKE
jgi:hypothetical protein